MTEEAGHSKLMCSRCAHELEPADFSAAQRKKEGRSRRCNTCVASGADPALDDKRLSQDVGGGVEAVPSKRDGAARGGKSSGVQKIVTRADLDTAVQDAGARLVVLDFTAK